MEMASHTKSLLNPIETTSPSMLPSITAFRSIIKHQYDDCFRTWCFKTWPNGGDVAYTSTTVQACYIPAPAITIPCSYDGSSYDPQGSAYSATQPTSAPALQSPTHKSSSSDSNSKTLFIPIYTLLGILLIGMVIFGTAILFLLLKKKPPPANNVHNQAPPVEPGANQHQPQANRGFLQRIMARLVGT